MEKLVPKIRFPGFTDPWKQRKLGSLTTRILRKNKNLESELPLTISAQDGLVDQETFFNKRVAGKDLENYLLIKNGEFAYNKSYSAGFPWGAVKRLEKYEKGVVSSLYILFSVIENKVDPIFLETYFETDRWYDEMRIRAAEGARNHGLLNIPASDFFDIQIKLPSLDEQMMIGHFFVNLNHLITLHQRKLDELKTLKKGLLQKLFPKDGESIPEIRFPGFTDPWKQRKLGELSEIIKDGTHGTHKNEPGSGCFLLSAKNLKNGKIILSDDEREITKKDFEQIEKSFKVDKDDLLLSIVGTIGEVVLVKNALNMVFQRSVAMIRPNKNINTSFLAYEFQTASFKTYLADHQSISAQPGIYLGDLARANIIYPSLSEQHLIGTFFQHLDHLITLHQRKLDELKELKKGLLQQMFV